MSAFYPFADSGELKQLVGLCQLPTWQTSANHCGRALTIGVQKASAMAVVFYFLVLFPLTFAAQRVERRLARAD